MLIITKLNVTIVDYLSRYSKYTLPENKLGLHYSQITGGKIITAKTTKQFY